MYGMQSRFTEKFEVGDLVIAERWGRKQRFGLVTKKWKNHVVVVLVEPDWVVVDDGRLMQKERVDDHFEIKFNPDGNGRGDQYAWILKEFTGDDAEADRIRRDSGIANWDQVWQTAEAENKNRDQEKANLRKREAEFEQAQIDNKENRENGVMVATAVNHIFVMDIVNKYGRKKALLITVSQNDDRHLGRGREWNASSVVVESLRYDVARFQSVQSWYDNDRERLMKRIIHQYWDWS